MVNAPEGLRGAERRLVLSYAPAPARAALAALLALDDQLAVVVRTTRAPLVGQMRLTWWHDALAALDGAPPPAEPVLAALAAHVLPRGVAGAALAPLVEGWEALLEETLGAAELETHAAARGARLFAAAAAVLGVAPVAGAGEGWALADLARHLSAPGEAAAARIAAEAALAAAFARGWPLRARALGALALLARLDLAGVRSPARRTARLLAFRLAGR
jgi:15-cis-phytoene synthase